jgi:hypothetical protein
MTLHPSNTPLSFRLLRAAQILLFANVVIWLIFGSISILRIFERHPEQYVIAWVIALMMLGNAAAMGLAGWAIAQRGFWTFFALAVLGVNIVLTFTDQVGFLDWATFAINLAILGCWWGSRRLLGAGR